MLKYKASGGSVCIAIIFWSHSISDIFLTIHCYC